MSVPVCTLLSFSVRIAYSSSRNAAFGSCIGTCAEAEKRAGCFAHRPAMASLEARQ